jgi:SpoVK/Ycf46/Vps4 family AAA+-type ATPase
VSIYIDESFRRPVRTHLLANLLSDVPEFPLILGVFGPAGTGKTFQVEKICAELGLTQLLLSPGELESENAGAPGQLLRRMYLEAGDQIRQGRPSILVIHDIDTILGHWGDLVQYTVNRQVVYAQLMAFCDFPNQVGGHETGRVPIVVTGNNPSILYGPLLRPGRMRLLRWQPNLATRVRMAEPLFPLINPADLLPVISKYEHKEISFWSDVRAFIIEDRVSAAVESIGSQIRQVLSSGSRIQVPDEIRSIDEVVAVAAHLDSMDLRSDNYLSAVEGRN